MNKKRTAFTLMETTLALTLLTIGMLGLAGVFSQIIKANASVMQKQTALFLADARLAQMCSSPLSKTARQKGTFNEPFALYSWQVQFRYDPDNKQIADVWLEVKHKSNNSVTLWTQMVIDDVQS